MTSNRELTAAPRTREDGGLLWRILLLVIGAALVVTGWSLVMTAILAFIGLPIFIFGLALMQAQER